MSSRLVAAAAVAVLVPVAAACSSADVEPGRADRLIVVGQQCPEMGPTVPFGERHPDKGQNSWDYLASEVLAPAVCAHEGKDVNLLAIGASDFEGRSGVSFAVDFDNGFLYNKIHVAGFGRQDLLKPEGTLREPGAVLSPEALAQLRQAIDDFHVLEWPDREPGEWISAGDMVVDDGFKLAAIFYDDTGVYVERPQRSDQDVVAFVHFAQDFLAQHLDQ